jgi:DNA-binding IscR family transcriptional regulator
MEDGEDIYIDTELWLQVLLALSGNEEDRLALVEVITQRSGVSPDKVEKILAALMQYLMQTARAN